LCKAHIQLRTFAVQYICAGSKIISMSTQNKRLTIIVSVVAFLLLIPFIAMQFTNEVNWNLFDFIAAAVLLLGTGLLCEFVMRKVKKNTHRIIISTCTTTHLGRTCCWYFRFIYCRAVVASAQHTLYIIKLLPCRTCLCRTAGYYRKADTEVRKRYIAHAPKLYQK
jgi:uncharacterized integral membrane protein